MATITATDMTGNGARAVTETTLTGTADTFTYNAARSPVLILRNDTAGAISPTITGDEASATYAVTGVGSIDLSGGFAVGSIAAGAIVAIPLVKIAQYLTGTIAITSGTDLDAQLLEF